jgi:hypothetical protein
LFADGTATDGTGRREAYRTTLAPVARIVAEELSAKLETDVDLSFDNLFAAVPAPLQASALVA